MSKTPEKGTRCRLVSMHNDNRWTRIKALSPDGTAASLEESRAGYLTWNLGDLEIESKTERHARIAKEAIGF